MEWVERMNQAITYIENHLCEEVDPEEISRIMACPSGVFQRSFALIVGVPLSEYIRRRKLTGAAHELRNTEERVIDIAVKYGYDSADAFSVAFKRMHGVNPSSARQPDVQLKFYSRLHFTLSITGVDEMEYRVVDKEPFKVLGRRLSTPNAGGTWGAVKSDGSIEGIQGINPSGTLLGLCFGFDGEGNNDYMVGVESENRNAPGFDEFIYPQTKWLIFEASGAISANALRETWKRIYGEFLPQSEFSQSSLPTIEAYHQWDLGTDTCKVEIWIPVQ